ncbi:hypothetical protein [Plesiomonas shigelloides]|uniref:hypothetical protein n=1 Tax=Plesiomonas shigelloides TaxID=703 RepID=UPI00057AD4E1|nr:hypothetical protein [Plesiomonas shigelloides]KAB7681707.1 hypothetical protein GBN16_00840 [Plesiomonas shigelloides]
MIISSQNLEKNIDRMSKIATAIAKLGVVIGALCITIYSLRIHHFPQDLSLSDGLLLFMMGSCFGIIYLLIIISFMNLGIVFSPIIKLIFKLIAWISNSFTSKKTVVKYQLAPFNLTSIPLSVVAIILIFKLGEKEPFLYFSLSTLTIGLYLFYSIYMSCAEKIKNETLKNNHALVIDVNKSMTNKFECEHNKRVQLISLFIMVFAPLFASGISGAILDAAMRATNIRIESSTVYIKEPYSSLIPKDLILDNLMTPKEYIALNKVTILFTGFGKNTIISFNNDSKVEKIKIPNDHIIIVQQY